MAGLAAGLVAAVVAGMTGVTWYWSEAQRRQEAELRGNLARQAVNLLARVPETDFDTRIDPIKTELLENVLGYFQQATDRADRDPVVRLEDGRTYQQMGDILRTLGRLADSERAYRRSAELLQPQAAVAGDMDRERKRALARTHTLLADLLVRHGTDPDQTGALYRQAVEAQQALVNEPASGVEDRLELGHTLRSEADLLRLQGQFAPARPICDQAIAVLELARGTDAKHAAIRNELALALDTRGWIHREIGAVDQAERDTRHALGLLEALIADFPTVPRHRETLIRICERLGLLEQETGRLADAEAHYRQELPQVERLAQDFPERFEYLRELARTLFNLGVVLVSQHRIQDAEPILLRAVTVHVTVAARSQGDVQIKFNLGARKLGRTPVAKGRSSSGPRVNPPGALDQRGARPGNPRPTPPRQSPGDRPHHLGPGTDRAGPAGLGTHVPRRRRDLRQAGHGLPRESRLSHRTGDVPSRPGRRPGRIAATAGRGDLPASPGEARHPGFPRQGAGVPASEGRDPHQSGEPPGATAEEALVQAIDISKSLISKRSSDHKDRFNMAIAQNNLADLFMKIGRLPDAGTRLAESVANFEKLVAEAPQSVDIQYVLGLALALQGKWFDQVGKLVDARTALTSAVEHQRRAVELSKNAPMCRERLGEHLAELAGIHMKLGNYDDAGRLALERSKTVPNSTRAQACLDAARILARLLARVGDDARLAQGDRGRLTRTYFGHTVGLLHEAIVRDPALLDRVVTDPVFEKLRRHPRSKRSLRVDDRAHQPVVSWFKNHSITTKNPTAATLCCRESVRTSRLEPNEAAMIVLRLVFVGLMIFTILAVGFAVARRDEPPGERKRIDKQYLAGNYKDAYEGYRRLALDPKAEPDRVGSDLTGGGPVPRETRPDR